MTPEEMAKLLQSISKEFTILVHPFGDNGIEFILRDTGKSICILRSLTAEPESPEFLEMMKLLKTEIDNILVTQNLHPSLALHPAKITIKILDKPMRLDDEELQMVRSEESIFLMYDINDDWNALELI